jgi:hypothetical protein
VSRVEFAERTTTFAERTATCSENPVQKSLTTLPNSAKSGTASKSPALILFCHEKVCVLFLIQAKAIGGYWCQASLFVIQSHENEELGVFESHFLFALRDQLALE